MDALGREERDSGSSGDLHSSHGDPEEIRDLSLENESVEEINKSVKSWDCNQEEHKKEVTDFDNAQNPDENIENTCANCESPTFNKTSRRKLHLDAMMISPPQLKQSPSEDDVVMASPRMEDTRATVRLNTRALPKESRTYELEKFQKNSLIIFNQESIDGFEPRLGTEQDVKALTETFKNFGFDVKVYKDFTKDKVIEVLETYKTTNFTDYGCVGITVLTHGTFNGTLRARDQVYSETDIIKYFRVYDKPTLVTKPKFLIIQACRGTRCLPGVHVQRQGNLKKDLDEELEPYTLPVMSDVLIVHSSYIGEASTRDEIHGSWFIQTLCSKINEMSPVHDLETIMTEVKREVAADRHWEDINRATGEIDIFKQMPTVTSTLIRKLYLRKFGDESPPVTFRDAAVPSTSSGPALDTAVSPLLYQFGPCSCFLDHFDYIKNCLTFYVEENPSDAGARSFLEISNTFEDEDKFNAAKETMAKAICKHLSLYARDRDYFKFVYLYKH